MKDLIYSVWLVLWILTAIAFLGLVTVANLECSEGVILMWAYAFVVLFVLKIVLEGGKIIHYYWPRKAL
jgi:hypothetical protein